MNGKSFIYGLVIGGALAGISTLLTTPTSGAVKRAQVKSAGRNIQSTIDELKNEALQVKDQVAQALEEGKATVGHLAEEIQVSVDLWQNSIKPHQEAIQQNIANVEKELENIEKELAKNNPK